MYVAYEKSWFAGTWSINRSEGSMAMSKIAIEANAKTRVCLFPNAVHLQVELIPTKCPLPPRRPRNNSKRFLHARNHSIRTSNTSNSLHSLKTRRHGSHKNRCHLLRSPTYSHQCYVSRLHCHSTIEIGHDK